MTRGARFGLQLGSRNLAYLIVVAIATALITATTHLERPDIWATTSAAALLLGVLTYRSRTPLGWLGRRLALHRSPRDTILIYEAQGAGITWDGQRAATYIEVLPAPYATTIIGTDNETTIRALPLDAIREELVQFDIRCASITAVTFGHKYHRHNELATAYQAAIGPVPALLYGRTYIEVTVTLANSLDSVYARRGTDDIPAGLSRTVCIAAERIRRRIAHEGWKTKLLNKTDLQALHDEIGDQLIPALTQEHWASCGPQSMQAIAFTPKTSSSWTTTNYREWCRLTPHRQVHITRLDRRRGTDHAEMYIGLLTSDPNALNTVTALGLRREYGQQGDIFTAALPIARTVRPTVIPGTPLPKATEFPIPLTPAGIGTFIGHTNTRAQVFVNFTVGAEPFYVIGPAAMCQQLLVWLATSGRTINITLSGDHWKNFATRIGANYRNARYDDIIVCDEADLTAPAHPSQVRIIWTGSAPTATPIYAIVAATTECTLHTPDGQTRYRWSVSTAEQAFFTVARPGTGPRPTPTPPARHAAVT